MSPDFGGRHINVDEDFEDLFTQTQQGPTIFVRMQKFKTTLWDRYHYLIVVYTDRLEILGFIC